MRSTWLIAVAAFVTSSVAAQTSVLPLPAEIEPDVNFWVRIYTEVSTSGGLIHDSRHLGVVYRVINFADGLGRSARNRQLRAANQEIKDVLAVLADGKRAQLTAEEQRILALWPDDVSNAELSAASGRLRFQLGQSDRFRAGLIRSGTWRGYIADELAERGLPSELVALPHVESSFDPTAYSKVGAAGMWQFTRSTGLRYMRIDHIVDERRDPFTATIAAAQLLENNNDVLQSWPLAITAYNHGQAGMRRAKRQLGTDAIEVILRNYDGRTFGFASRNFYVAFLAAVQVDTNYEDYFGSLEFADPARSELLEIPDYMTVATLQAALDTDRGVLRSWNPALTEAVWGGDKFVPRGFKLRLPSRMVADSESALANISGTQRYTAQMPDIIHRVRSGDTVSQIADRYRVSATSLVQLNGLRSRNFIRAGQILRLPGSEGTVPMTLAQRRGEQPLTEEQRVANEPSADTYVVRSGDTIDLISRRLGVSEDEILARNGIADKNRIYVGQALRVRGAQLDAEVSQISAASASASPSVQAISESQVTESQAAEPQVVATGADETAMAAAVLPTETIVVEENIILANADQETAPVEFQPAERVPAPPVLLGSAPRVTLAEEAALAVVTDSQSLEQDFSTDENVLASEQAEMAADPSDYLVREDGTIEVQALETLGHYADWLGIRTQRLRELNNFAFQRAVVIGQRLELNFSEVDRATFEQRRMEYQRQTQEAFFLAYQITDTREHVVRPGESLWVLALRTYDVPVWLLRQFNPDLDLDRVNPGTVVKFPALQAIARTESASRAALQLDQSIGSQI
jgi:membrane-bound lytic murein transglycosylase D